MKAYNEFNSSNWSEPFTIGKSLDACNPPSPTPSPSVVDMVSGDGDLPLSSNGIMFNLFSSLIYITLYSDHI